MHANRLLVVTPHFPPINAPDMHRVRLSLPFFKEWGWTPYVLAVAPTETEKCEPLLLSTLPSDLPVERVGSMPLSITRLAGVGSLALRALPFLYRAGRRMIAEHRIDLVYFSTTAFFAMPLGRAWKRALGTPFVLDFQDPWLSDYYETHPAAPPPPKYQIARRAHAFLERWTVQEAAGIVSVSPAYIESLESRYPHVRRMPSVTLPFGASRADFDAVAQHPQVNRHFSPNDGRVHCVSTGRGGEDMSTALEILFGALRAGLDASADAFEHVRLHFVGTSYAADSRASKTVEPIAERLGVRAHVTEDTTRTAYFEALQLLADGDLLLLVGSDDPSYSASKVYPYVLSGKPILAVLHEHSPLVGVLREIGAGSIVTFSSNLSESEKAGAVARLLDRWKRLLAATPQTPTIDWARFERFSAREMARRQCELFDRVLGRRTAAVA